MRTHLHEDEGRAKWPREHLPDKTFELFYLRGKLQVTYEAMEVVPVHYSWKIGFDLLV